MNGFIKKSGMIFLSLMLVGCGNSSTSETRTNDTNSDQKETTVEKDEVKELHVCSVTKKENGYPITQSAKIYGKSESDIPDKIIITIEMKMDDIDKATDDDLETLKKGLMKGFNVDEDKVTVNKNANNTIKAIVNYDTSVMEKHGEKGSVSEWYENMKSSGLFEECDGTKLEVKTNTSDNTTTSDTSDNANQSQSESTATGIRPEIKEVIDNYEQFMTDYTDFMSRYYHGDTSTQMSMMGELSDYMTRYNDMVQQFDNLKNQDLTSEELLYFTQVQQRVAEMTYNAIK